MVFTLDCLGRGAQVKKGACRYHEIVQKRASILDDSLSSVFFIVPIMQCGHDTRPRVQP